MLLAAISQVALTGIAGFRDRENITNIDLMNKKYWRFLLRSMSVLLSRYRDDCSPQPNAQKRICYDWRRIFRRLPTWESPSTHFTPRARQV